MTAEPSAPRTTAAPEEPEAVLDRIRNLRVDALSEAMVARDNLSADAAEAPETDTEIVRLITRIRADVATYIDGGGDDGAKATRRILVEQALLAPFGGSSPDEGTPKYEQYQWLRQQVGVALAPPAAEPAGTGEVVIPAVTSEPAAPPAETERVDRSTPTAVEVQRSREAQIQRLRDSLSDMFGPLVAMADMPAEQVVAQFTREGVAQHPLWGSFVQDVPSVERLQAIFQQTAALEQNTEATLEEVIDESGRITESVLELFHTNETLKYIFFDSPKSDQIAQRIFGRPDIITENELNQLVNQVANPRAELVERAARFATLAENRALADPAAVDPRHLAVLEFLERNMPSESDSVVENYETTPLPPRAREIVFSRENNFRNVVRNYGAALQESGGYTVENLMAIMQADWQSVQEMVDAARIRSTTGTVNRIGGLLSADMGEMMGGLVQAFGGDETGEGGGKTEFERLADALNIPWMRTIDRLVTGSGIDHFDERIVPAVEQGLAALQAELESYVDAEASRAQTWLQAYKEAEYPDLGADNFPPYEGVISVTILANNARQPEWRALIDAGNEAALRSLLQQLTLNVLCVNAPSREAPEQLDTVDAFVQTIPEMYQTTDYADEYIRGVRSGEISASFTEWLNEDSGITGMEKMFIRIGSIFRRIARFIGENLGAVAQWFGWNIETLRNFGQPTPSEEMQRHQLLLEQRTLFGNPEVQDHATQWIGVLNDFGSGDTAIRSFLGQSMEALGNAENVRTFLADENMQALRELLRTRNKKANLSVILAAWAEGKESGSLIIRVEDGALQGSRPVFEDPANRRMVDIDLDAFCGAENPEALEAILGEPAYRGDQEAIDEALGRYSESGAEGSRDYKLTDINALWENKEEGDLQDSIVSLLEVVEENWEAFGMTKERWELLGKALEGEPHNIVELEDEGNETREVALGSDTFTMEGDALRVHITNPEDSVVKFDTPTAFFEWLEDGEKDTPDAITEEATPDTTGGAGEVAAGKPLTAEQITTLRSTVESMAGRLTIPSSEEDDAYAFVFDVAVDDDGIIRVTPNNEDIHDAVEARKETGIIMGAFTVTPADLVDVNLDDPDALQTLLRQKSAAGRSGALPEINENELRINDAFNEETLKQAADLLRYLAKGETIEINYSFLELDITDASLAIDNYLVHRHGDDLYYADDDTAIESLLDWATGEEDIHFWYKVGDATTRHVMTPEGPVKLLEKSVPQIHDDGPIYVPENGAPHVFDAEGNRLETSTVEHGGKTWMYFDFWGPDQYARNNNGTLELANETGRGNLDRAREEAEG